MKKGLLILSDMTWLLVFLISVTFIFFFLYKPLHQHITDRVYSQGMSDDAAFIAATLPRLNAEKNERFDQILYNLSTKRLQLSGATLQSTDEYADYVNSLDRIFAGTGGLSLWTIWSGRSASQDMQPSLYTLVLRTHDNYLLDTCVEETPSGHKQSGQILQVCNNLNQMTDGQKVAGLPTAAFDNTISGIAYLPGPQGPIIMQLFITYSKVYNG